MIIFEITGLALRRYHFILSPVSLSEVVKHKSDNCLTDNRVILLVFLSFFSLINMREKSLFGNACLFTRKHTFLNT